MLRWAVMLFDVFVVIAGTMILLSLTIADSRLIKSLGSAKPTTLAAFRHPGPYAFADTHLHDEFHSVLCDCDQPLFYRLFSIYCRWDRFDDCRNRLQGASSLLPERMEKIRKSIGPVILLSSMYITGATVPSYINNTAKIHELSRAEDVRLIEKISFLSETGAVPLITPYFPNFQLPGQEGLGKAGLRRKYRLQMARTTGFS